MTFQIGFIHIILPRKATILREEHWNTPPNMDFLKQGTHFGEVHRNTWPTPMYTEDHSPADRSLQKKATLSGEEHWNTPPNLDFLKQGTHFGEEHRNIWTTSL